MYDIAISSHGDLILAANRDLGGVSGIDLLDQRVRIRLTIHRGGWIFDPDEILGSNLYQILGQAPQAALNVDAYVREALRPMNDEITVEDVLAEYSEDQKSLIVQVQYSQIYGGPQDDLQTPGGDIQTSTVTIPYVLGEG